MAETESRCQFETILAFLGLWTRDVFKTLSELNDSSERIWSQNLIRYVGFSHILCSLQLLSSLRTTECQ